MINGRPGVSKRSRIKVRRNHWALLIIPYIWCIGLIPVANNVEYVFGSIPFLLVWMTLGVLLSSTCIYIVYRIDKASGQLEVV